MCGRGATMSGLAVSFLSAVAVVHPRSTRVAHRGWLFATRCGVKVAQQLVGRVSLAVPKPMRLPVIVIHDVTAAAISLPAAAYLRFGTLDLPAETVGALLSLVPAFAAIFLA